LTGIPILTSSFITDNTDWFGNPINPKTVKITGPGLKYSTPYSYLSEIGGVLDMKSKENTIKQNPELGPGTYNSDKEPSKVSFFLNQNNIFIP